MDNQMLPLRICNYC